MLPSTTMRPCSPLRVPFGKTEAVEAESCTGLVSRLRRTGGGACKGKGQPRNQRRGGSNAGKVSRVAVPPFGSSLILARAQATATVPHKKLSGNKSSRTTELDRNRQRRTLTKVRWTQPLHRPGGCRRRLTFTLVPTAAPSHFRLTEESDV